MFINNFPLIKVYYACYDSVSSSPGAGGCSNTESISPKDLASDGLIKLSRSILVSETQGTNKC